MDVWKKCWLLECVRVTLDDINHPERCGLCVTGNTIFIEISLPQASVNQQVPWDFRAIILVHIITHVNYCSCTVIHARCHNNFSACWFEQKWTEIRCISC